MTDWKQKIKNNKTNGDEKIIGRSAIKNARKWQKQIDEKRKLEATITKKDGRTGLTKSWIIEFSNRPRVRWNVPNPNGHRRREPQENMVPQENMMWFW